MRTPRRAPRLGVSIALSLTLLLTACGGDPAADTGTATDATGTPDDTTSSPSPEAAEASFPVTVAPANGEVTIDSRPEAIVSLSPTATEMLFAIGAGEQVIAVDSLSNHPPAAPTTELSAFEPSVEAISEFGADLVVLAFDPGDIVAGLAAIGVPSLLLAPATSLDDSYGQIELLGQATGNPADAAEVVTEMRTDLEELAAQVPEFSEAPTYYHEIDATYFTATSETFIGQLYALAGLDNIADAADGAAEAGGFPQLSPEYIIEADPDLIFLADTKCCDVTPESVAQRPGWEQITAVRDGNVVALDDDVVSRWGPRIVDFFRTVVEQLAMLQPAS